VIRRLSTIHEIRLANRNGLLRGVCSCGWASPEVVAVSAAATAAVIHSKICGGVATIGTTETTCTP
jgi:hypothetical protein